MNELQSRVDRFEELTTCSLRVRVFRVPTDRKAPPENALVRPVMPELDVLRGIAILAVVLYHNFSMAYEGVLHFSKPAEIFIHWTGSGWLGVNLFFVLSGFLITGILLESKGDPNYYRRFYLRRALRILPIFYSLLMMLLIFGWSTWPYFALNLVFLSNVTALLGVKQTCGWLWSLAVEEHYYSVWPAIARRLSQPRLAQGALTICIAVPLLRGGWFALGHNGLGLRSWTWFVADNLAMGSLLAIAVRAMTRKHALRLCLGLLLIGAGLAGLAGGSYGLLRHGLIHGYAEAILQLTFAGIFFGGLLLLFLLLGTSSWSWLTRWPFLSFLGYISYGLYLFHPIVFSLYDAVARRLFPSLQPQDYRFDLVVLRFVLGGGVSVGLTYLSRKYFEERFLRLKKPLEAKYLNGSRLAEDSVR